MDSFTVYATPYEPNRTGEFRQELESHYMNIVEDNEEPTPSESRETSLEESQDESSSSPIDAYKDDRHVYTNLAEMEEINNRSQPPLPDSNDQPRRVLYGGWMEYVNEAGRSYFFNSETGRAQWIPPRLMRSPSQVQAFLEATRQMGLQAATESEQATIIDQQATSQASSVESSRLSTSLDETTVSPKYRESICRKESLEESDRVVSMSTFQHSAPFSIKNLSQSQSISRLAHQSPPSTRSLSYKNRTTSLKQVALPQVLPIAPLGGIPHFDAPAPPLDEVVPTCISSSDYINDDRMSRGGSSESRMEVRTVRSGPMERVIGERAKKREWTGCYLFLTSAHLLVYKDERSAEKHGKHYEAPQMACDLKGAAVSWVVEKEKRRRRIFQLELSNGQALHLRTTTDSLTEDWFESLREVISQLPSISSQSLSSVGIPLPGPVVDATPMLVRNPSAISIVRPHSTCAPLRTTVKKDSRSDPMTVSAVDPPYGRTMDSGVSTMSQTADHHQTPSRGTIIERLKRFFRTRPTVESLKEKGIYKPEPVFGSTLVAICQLEECMVPKFIKIVTELIENKGLEVDGLYRVSGNLSAVQKIRCQVDQNRYQLLVNEEDVHVLTGALKLFFRELAEPVFPLHMTKDFLGAIKLQNAKQRFKRFDELLNNLPQENKETLKMLLRHLSRVAKHADKNRMQVHNLAIMFGPTLFSNGEEPRVKKSKSDGKKKKKDEPAPIQSNSHLAFNMIMQGQIVEYLLNEQNKFEALQGPLKN